MCAGPLAGVNVTAVVVKILDCVVGHQVAVAEEETVQTQTCGELEVVGSIPFLLAVDAKLVEAHAGGRGLLAIVAVGQTNHLGCSTVDKVIHAAVAIVTGTVAHVLVVSHLILVADTSHKLMVAVVVGNVVLDVEDSIVHGIVPGEELIAKGHVLSGSVGAIVNVDEGEFRRVAATYIVKL